MNADVDAAARTLAALLDEVRASVVITYDENGYYGHPDHVKANVVTRRALDFAESPERLYYPVTPRSLFARFVPQAGSSGSGCRRGCSRPTPARPTSWWPRPWT